MFLTHTDNLAVPTAAHSRVSIFSRFSFFHLTPQPRWTYSTQDQQLRSRSLGCEQYRLQASLELECALFWRKSGGVRYDYLNQKRMLIWLCWRCQSVILCPHCSLCTCVDFVSSLVIYFVIISQKKWSVCNSDVDHRLLLRAADFSFLPSAGPQFLENSGTDSVLYYYFFPMSQ